jgi:predicted acetyltransferase
VLIAPTIRLHASWLAAHAEWGPGAHEDGFGLLHTDETLSSAGFSAWLNRLADTAGVNDAGRRTGSGCVHRWIVDGDEVLGGIALRHGDDDLIRSARHISVPGDDWSAMGELAVD